MAQERNQVFISYSNKDEKWLDELQTMLKPLMRNQTISVWNDRNIRAGAKWKDEIKNALATAKVAVLMVSKNFLASDFIAEHQLPPLLKAAEEEGLTIIWICVSSCLYEETEIEEYQAAHDISQPLDSLNEAELNQALKNIGNTIKDQLRQQKDSQIKELNEQIENLNHKLNQEQSTSQQKDSQIKGLNEQIKNLNNELYQQQFGQLRELLKKQEWKDADKETARIMLEIINKNSWEDVTAKDIEDFPDEKLQEIDNIWNSANNNFGFTAQKEIWDKLKLDQNTERSINFGKQVGWYNNTDQEWLDYSEFQFNEQAPRGHLPTLGILGKKSFSFLFLINFLIKEPRIILSSEEINGKINEFLYALYEKTKNSRKFT